MVGGNNKDGLPKLAVTNGTRFVLFSSCASDRWAVESVDVCEKVERGTGLVAF